MFTINCCKPKLEDDWKHKNYWFVSWNVAALSRYVAIIFIQLLGEGLLFQKPNHQTRWGGEEWDSQLVSLGKHRKASTVGYGVQPWPKMILMEFDGQKIDLRWEWHLFQ